eukprot:484990-Prorocentrum_minimum.AAC.1
MVALVPPPLSGTPLKGSYFKPRPPGGGAAGGTAQSQLYSRGPEQSNSARAGAAGASSQGRLSPVSTLLRPHLRAAAAANNPNNIQETHAEGLQALGGYIRGMALRSRERAFAPLPEEEPSRPSDQSAPPDSRAEACARSAGGRGYVGTAEGGGAPPPPANSGGNLAGLARSSSSGG